MGTNQNQGLNGVEFLFQFQLIDLRLKQKDHSSYLSGLKIAITPEFRGEIAHPNT